MATSALTFIETEIINNLGTLGADMAALPESPEEVAVHLGGTGDVVHPDVLDRRFGVPDTRGYALSLVGDYSQTSHEKLNVSFFHSLCGTEYHILIDFIDNELRTHRTLAEALRPLVPDARISTLEKNELKKKGFSRWKEGRCYEIALSTASREVLDIAFHFAFINYGFYWWVLGERGEPFDVDTLRRLHLDKPYADLVEQVVRDFAGAILLQEYHGPVVYTNKVPQERVVEAARDAAAELGRPLHMHLDE